MTKARTGAKIEIYRQGAKKDQNHQLQTHFLKRTYGMVMKFAHILCADVNYGFLFMEFPVHNLSKLKDCKTKLDVLKHEFV